MARCLLIAVSVLLVVVLWFSTAEGVGICRNRCYNRCSMLKKRQRVSYWTCVQMCNKFSQNCRTCYGPRRCYKCSPGYILNNLRCVYDLCGTNNGGCSAQATCSAATGIVTCTCKIGYTGNGITCTATTCQIEALSGSDVRALGGTCQTNASISLNADAVFFEPACKNVAIIMLSVDPLTCTVLNGPVAYDTLLSVTASSALANELWKNTGTLYVAVTSICAGGERLSPALAALETACGVSLSDLASYSFVSTLRGDVGCASFAFICEAGYPGKTKFNMVAFGVPDYSANVTAAVTGTGSGMTIV